MLHVNKSDYSIIKQVAGEVKTARREIRNGRFQRSMAVITAFSAIVSGFEAYIQNRRGAFRNKWMWTPVMLAAPMVAAAGAAVASKKAARRVLPLAAAAALADGLVGFIYHLRGIRQLPGGLKVGAYNIVIGPPVFAPLLMSITGVLGGIASLLQRERLADLREPDLEDRVQVEPDKPIQSIEAEIAHGRFQQGMAATAAVLAALSGGEAYFEHLRGSYNQRVMWTPVWVTLPMVAAATGSMRSRRIARKFLPLASAAAFLDGMAGFFFHLRGLKRMPGGFRNTAFNVTMGPPLFAPLLFSAIGLLGFIASLLRRSG